MAHHAVGLLDGDAELIPSNVGLLPVGQVDVGGVEDVSDVVLAHRHLRGVEVDDVLVVAFRLAQSLVVVDVFHVRQA